MGSPVSAVVANLYMKKCIDISAIQTCPLVDDIWCIVKKGKEEELLHGPPEQCETINQVHHGAGEGREVIPFLYCSLQRGEDGMLTSTVYRKPTHTDRYLHYTPSSNKESLVCGSARAGDLAGDSTISTLCKYVLAG